jgi:hypothetical protein
MISRNQAPVVPRSRRKLESTEFQPNETLVSEVERVFERISNLGKLAPLSDYIGPILRQKRAGKEPIKTFLGIETSEFSRWTRGHAPNYWKRIDNVFGGEFSHIRDEDNKAAAEIVWSEFVRLDNDSAQNIPIIRKALRSYGNTINQLRETRDAQKSRENISALRYVQITAGSRQPRFEFDGSSDAKLLSRLRSEYNATLAWADEVRGRGMNTRWSDRLFPFAPDAELIAAWPSGDSSKRPRLIPVVGDSGSGKTFRVAKAIIADAATGLSIPIRLTAGDFNDLAKRLDDRFGLPHLPGNPLLDGMPEQVRERLLFISDALEQAGDITDSVKALLPLLSVASVIVTCRTRQWEEARRLIETDAEPIRVPGLEAARISSALGWTADSIAARPFLKLPILLALHLRQFEDREASHIPTPDTQTAILDTFRCAFIRESAVGDARRAPAQLGSLLQKLALAQLRLGSFEVPEAELLQESNITSQLLEEVKECSGLLVRDRPPASDQPTWRLRHDMLDAHNIAAIVLEQHGLFSDVTRWLNSGFGTSVCEILVRTAAERDPPFDWIIRDFFETFLGSVDSQPRKREGKHIPWNTGLVVEANIEFFLGLMIRVLQVEALSPEPTQASAPQISTAGDTPALTQSALSSVAGRFPELRKPITSAVVRAKAGASDALIRALENMLPKAKFKARLIEAIPFAADPKLTIPILREIARNAMDLPKHEVRDVQELTYIAKALAKVGQNAPGDGTAADGLRDLLSSAREYIKEGSNVVWRLVARAADVGLRRLGQNPEPMPLTVEEISAGLSRTSLGEPQYASDWVLVEDYCWYLEERLHELDDTAKMVAVERLGALLWHGHQRTNIVAAKALSFFDVPQARGFLLDAFALTEDKLTGTVILNSLEVHATKYLKNQDRPANYLRLAMVRASAARRRRNLPQLDEAFFRATRALPPNDVTVVTPDFVGLLYVKDPRHLEIGEPASGEPAALPEWMAEPERKRGVGEAWEKKYTFVPNDESEAGFRIEQSSWKHAKRLHDAVLDRLFPTDANGRRASPTDKELKRPLSTAECRMAAIGGLHAMFEQRGGDYGIAVVHVALLSADGLVIEGQRDLTKAYWPGAWSPGFEEQVTTVDFEISNNKKTCQALRACVLRGLSEEFLSEKELLKIENAINFGDAVLGVEWPIFNVALLVPITLPLNGNKIVSMAYDMKKQIILSGKKPELVEFRASPLANFVERLERTKTGSACFKDEGEPGSVYHPTSSARVDLLIKAFGSRSAL